MPYDPDAPLYNQDYLDFCSRGGLDPETNVAQQSWRDLLDRLIAAGVTVD